MDKQIATKIAQLIGNICIGYKGTSPDHSPPSTKADLTKFLESLEIPVVSTNEECTDGLSKQEIMKQIEDRFKNLESETSKFLEEKLHEEVKNYIDNIKSLYPSVAVSSESKPCTVDIKVYRGVEYDKQGVLSKTYSRAKIPDYKHVGDSGADAYVCFDDDTNPKQFIVVSPGQVVTVPLGISCYIPNGYEIQVRPRSGATSEGHISVFGTVDSDYRGVIKVNVVNLSPDPFLINEGDRLCQLVLSPVVKAEFNFVEGTINNDTSRGINGFGSTGK